MSRMCNEYCRWSPHKHEQGFNIDIPVLKSIHSIMEANFKAGCAAMDMRMNNSQTLFINEQKIKIYDFLFI